MLSHLAVLALLATGPSPASCDGDVTAGRATTEAAHLRDVMREPDPAIKRLVAAEMTKMRAVARMRDTLREMEPVTKNIVGAEGAELLGRR